MYSRYIPPPKSSTTNSNQIQASESLPQPKPQPTTYARYIPPPKSNTQEGNNHQTSQHVRFGDDDQEKVLDGDEPPAKKAKLTQDDSPEKSKNKSKKSKKNKKGREKDTDLEIPNTNSISNSDFTKEISNQDQSLGGENLVAKDDPNQETLLETSQEAPLQPVEKPTKEKKERKKQKKEKNISKMVPDTEDNAPKHYKAILERKAKSIQRAPEPADVVKEPEDGDVTMQDVSNGNSADIETDKQVDEPVLHGLEPLPQPKPVAPDTTKPTYETLPPWLAAPIRVSPQSTTPFSNFGISPELGITPEIAERLSDRGYKEAFAIQTGVIPLLLPHHCKTMQGDVLVSAATGSGKTLAYALPMIRDISNSNRHLTKLRGLVVLPTRELVRQVQQVCEQCVDVFALNGAKRRPRIAISMGSQPLEQEQNALVEREEHYDPEAYARRMRRLRSSTNSLSDEEDEGYNTEDEEKAAIRKREDKIQTLPDHVIVYKSKVDILICTPGRLVEHIKYTPGFSLNFVRWLVVDEADKLLGQNFQQWLDIVIPRLQTNSQPNARNHKQSNLSGVRKVVLSATMTRDLDQLEGLKLRRPKLVVLEGSEAKSDPVVDGNSAEHALPGLLEEAAIKVNDPNLKPLFLLDLLQSDKFLGKSSHKKGKQGEHNSDDSDDGDKYDETSSSGSDSDSDSDSGVNTASKLSKDLPTTTKEMPTVLIFTKSNETALRLSRLLALLSPALEPLTGTLTSTTPYANRRDTIRAFASGRRRVLVASDLVARGIDLPSLDHVVNYDVPSSVASYVHRVGRTARAGRAGRAWTLYTNPEARWFWKEIASENAISRRSGVERVRITDNDENGDTLAKKVEAYEGALERLGREAAGHHHHRV
ncbi:P-loop containing nucleoside triphosphate hydrolase protein [Biscogniauxia marginata]|nr:P-loop containing nucleoside triphosphate hydrolase protein [Biscogniauxia marginata]